jgi:hypothetical protein
MTIRKVGGLYFWKLGRFGGSFHVSKVAAPRQKASAPFVDYFGSAACAVLAVSAFLSF